MRLAPSGFEKNTSLKNKIFFFLMLFKGSEKYNE